MSPGSGASERRPSSEGCSDDDMTDMHRTVMAQLLRFVSAPLAGTQVQLVRGVLQPPGERATTRVVTWDGKELSTSMAYDLPLTDRSGDHIPWTVVIASLRHLINSEEGRGSGDRVVLDGLGIPVADARAEALRFFEHASFDLTDALHAAVYVLQPDTLQPGKRLRLSGFLLLDAGTVRLYVNEPSLAGRIGLDVALLGEDGRPAVGNTALMAALPSLVPDELEWNTSQARDPYGTTVYDFTHW